MAGLAASRGDARAGDRVAALLERRLAAGEAFFAAEATRIAELCRELAERFVRGGRLLAVGESPQAWSDARHVAVEFVHPVIVGKRALPALALAPGEVDALAEADDTVIRFEPLRIGDRLFEPPTDDPFVRQELCETLYHVVWELVHVFFEHRGLLEGRTERRSHDAGAAGFLYPFLAESEHDLDAVLTDVAASVRIKSEEVGRLREQTLAGGGEALAAAAAAAAAAFAAGGRLLALGNGGSATDAMDVVADLVAPPADRGWQPRPALDLTADTAIITALANDIGADVVFSRQVIAHGRPGDVLLAISTSGDSRSVVEALVEARRGGLMTIALVGYDGGRVAAEGLADHVVVTPSQAIPRIQEAQASAYHLLRELAEA
jgi:D-sedoheptulose 7-phosphate isomerase